MIPVFQPEPLNWNLAASLADEYGSQSQHSNFGPLVTELERRLALFLKTDPKRVVVFSNCTDAIASATATVVADSPVVIPGFSFLATLRSVQQIPDVEILVRDVEPESWEMISPQASDSIDTVYLPVCAFGSNPTNLAKLFSGKRAVFDCAASVGSQPDLSNIEKSHAYCFSLHATKVLGSGEGGFAVFGSSEWAEAARAWSNFGRRDTSIVSGGINGKMSETQAAFCLSRLVEWESEKEQWLKVQQIAQEVSREHKLMLSPSAFSTVNPYWIVKFRDASETAYAAKFLADRGISTRKWWGFPLGPACNQGNPRVSLDLSATTLGLPFFRGIDLELISRDISQSLGALSLQFQSGQA